jgi:hypothetical protein
MKVCAESGVIGTKWRSPPMNGCVTPLRMANSCIFEAIHTCRRARRFSHGGYAALW